jgi:hypothetical protein
MADESCYLVGKKIKNSTTPSFRTNVVSQKCIGISKYLSE